MDQAEQEIERTKQYVEAQKVVFDYVKHITTLDTGSVLLLALLLEKFFLHPQWKWMIRKKEGRASIDAALLRNTGGVENTRVEG